MFSEVSCLCACFTSFSKKHWKYTLVQCKCQPCYTTRLSNQLHTELIAVESSLRTFRWNWRLWRLERPKICQAQRLLEVQYLQIRYQVVRCAARWWASSFHSGAVQPVCCSIWSLMKYAVQPLSAFKTILHISNRRPRKLHLYCTMCFLQYLQINEVRSAASISF